MTNALIQAPVSLAGALEEYLNDPNFEQNRIEYKTNKEIADRNAKNGVKPTPKPAGKGKSLVPSPLVRRFTNTGSSARVETGDEYGQRSWYFIASTEDRVEAER